PATPPHSPASCSTSSATTSFFFTSSGHPRHLHSFPTRRSSDLNRRQLNSLQNTWPYGYSMPIAVRYTQDAFSRSGWLNCDGHTVDRKSGSAGMPRPISYAVFCLKKKIKTEDENSVKIGGNSEVL